jgi:hypothetical protein
VFVMGLQALSGVAKDLTKMSSKSAVKFVAGEGGAVPARGDPHRFEERAEGRRLLPRRRAAVVDRLRRCAVVDGHHDHVVLVAVGVLLDEDIGKAKVKPPLRFDPVEVDGDQPAVGGPVLPVRVARHLVRRRAADLPRRRARLAVTVRSVGSSPRG